MARETLKNCLMTVGPLLFLVFPLSAWTGDKNGGEQSTPSGVELRHKYIATGDNHSLAVTCDGRVYAWGNNNNCEVGPTDFNDAEDLAVQIPLPVEELKPGAVEVIGGGYHSMALMSDGTVYAWGANVEGQLGVQTTRASPCRSTVRVTWVI
jgi:alpha-tubulin suppressor-like RCC1 family protein